MDLTSILERNGAALNAKTVFSEPIQSDGAVVVLAAKIGGGGGGGEGTQGQASSGGGVGFGLGGKPQGAFIFRGGKVHWRPAVDVNRVILGAQVVAVVALLSLRSIIIANAVGGARRRIRRRLLMRAVPKIAKRRVRRAGRRVARRAVRRGTLGRVFAR